MLQAQKGASRYYRKDYDFSRCHHVWSTFDCDKQETLEELKPQGVSDITNITVRDDSGSRKNTNTLIITFKAPAIPKYLHIGYQCELWFYFLRYTNTLTYLLTYLRVPVSPYIPNPLHCFKCQKFGHGKNACRGRETCATCGQVGHISRVLHKWAEVPQLHWQSLCLQ